MTLDQWTACGFKVIDGVLVKPSKPPSPSPALKTPPAATGKRKKAIGGTLTFTLPIRTCSEANQREHWAAKARRVKQQRVTVGFWWNVHDRLRVRPPCSVTLTRIAPCELDDDNLVGSFKACRDQIAEELGVNDRDPSVTWHYAQRKGNVREYGVECEIKLCT